jgi:Na+:H+ antiporter, NhaA family
VVGDRRWPASAQLGDLLEDAGIAHQWLDPADDPAARALLAEAGADGGTQPVVLAPDGRILVAPSREDLLVLAGSAQRDLTTS